MFAHNLLLKWANESQRSINVSIEEENFESHTDSMKHSKIVFRCTLKFSFYTLTYSNPLHSSVSATKISPSPN